MVVLEGEKLFLEPRALGSLRRGTKKQGELSTEAKGQLPVGEEGLGCSSIISVWC